jgi:hypothetical protein
VTEHRSPLIRTPSAVAVFTAAAMAFAVLLLTPAARGDSAAVLWNTPTPVDQSHFATSVNTSISFKLVASAPESVHIAALGTFPDGANLAVTDGPVANATFSWTPSQAGDYTVQFTATGVSGGSAPTLTYFIHVIQPVQYPRTYTLTDDKVAHYAFVMKTAIVRSQPKASARVVTKLPTLTGDFTQNLVLVLDGIDVSRGKTWYHVRLPILPNNSTGWVRRGYLSDLQTVHTHLYVDRTAMTATLQRDGVTIFKTIVGVGRSYWPTPHGQFYIRDKLTNFGDPFYGPVAFGTSARSAVLTDWPGGGFVGVHGTNEPGILPGHVSHGCIRMRNATILKLSRLMPVGTPLTVS